MFRSLLVPLDGSRFAEAALPLALRVARAEQARMHLFLAHQLAPAAVGAGEVSLPSPGLDHVLREKEESYLVDTAARLGQVEGGPIEWREVDGPPGPAVCAEAERVGADLIVMATHGRSAIGRLWLGSVAHHVVRHLEVPVLLVHPNGSSEPRELPQGAGILVALDLSKHAEAVLEPVATLARPLQAHVTLLHVVEPPYQPVEPAAQIPVDPVINEVRRADAQSRLEAIADRLRQRGLDAATRVMVGPSAAAAVLDALEDRRYDMVAMTTHGASGMRRLFLGGVADKVIRSARKPVLMLRPAPLPEE